NPTKKCANCGGPHTASYRGCPNYPKIHNNAVKKVYSYAAATRSINTQRIPQPAKQHTAPTNNTPNNPPPALNMMNEEFSDVFRLLNHLKFITQAIPNLKNLLNKLDNETKVEN
ncbi:hypothetical protein AVEN_54526-2-1, partial [Araneus ventricosus]